MRVSIREQLGSLIFLSSLISLSILSIAVWCVNYKFVLAVSATRLYTSASLKAAQIATDLELMTILVNTLTTRNVLHDALINYDDGSNTSAANFYTAQQDITAALGQASPSTGPLLLQAQIFTPNGTSVVAATGRGLNIALPEVNLDGGNVYLGDPEGGYPSALYPNISVIAVNGSNFPEYDGFLFTPGSTLVLGPIAINSTSSLMSITLPIVQANSTQLLGLLTAILDATLLRQVIDEPEGLGTTGQTLLFGPANTTNVFENGITYDTRNSSSPDQDFDVRFVFPLNGSQQYRHPDHVWGSANKPFPASEYPAVYDAFTDNNRDTDNAATDLDTTNEAGETVSVGYALIPTEIVDWCVVVEEDHSEVWAPIRYLRVLILACLFGVSGLVALIAIPLAHFAVLPIRRLRKASEHTIISSDVSDGDDSCQSSSFDMMSQAKRDGSQHKPESIIKRSFAQSCLRWRNRKKPEVTVTCRAKEGTSFRIPSKVPKRKHLFSDELSDLVLVFNDMVDELLEQYQNLEEKIRLRTAELDASKKAAEAANESKTLFIANLSHELKTPLNGILGMCSICMQENDFTKTKQSLRIIYKSGDLLLKLLSDLLLFSENQIGRKVVSIDEKEFRLADIEEQVTSIFSKQADEGGIALRVIFENQLPNQGAVTDMRDMILWGDIHRILQICINLLSNALKFSPRGGTVTLTIRCSLEQVARSRTVKRAAAAEIRQAESSPASGTANFINPRERRRADEAAESQASVTPTGKDVLFEFKVQDNGPGISEELQQRIFEPFVQGDVGLNRKYGGTGLGLSICTQLAKLMKGTVSVNSSPPDGSQFCLRLPLRHTSTSSVSPRTSRDITSSERGVAAEKNGTCITRHDIAEENHAEELPTRPELVASTASSSGTSENSTIVTPTSELTTSSPDRPTENTANAEKPFSALRILVAEDNPVNQEIAKRMLKLESVSDITMAANGQEAVDFVTASMKTSEGEEKEKQHDPSSCAAKIDTRPYDIIFMDIQMPIMGGLQSTRLIREAGCKVPIIALTAFSADSNVQACYANGMDYFLGKPLRRPHLRKVLAEYCLCPQQASESPSEKETVRPDGKQEDHLS